jgi:hypothetical protein
MRKVFFIIGLLMGCVASTLAQSTGKVTLYPPPSFYSRWWTEIQDCTNLHVDKNIVKKQSWYMVESPNFMIRRNGPLLGYNFVDSNYIYVVQSRMLDEVVIKHEMTHTLVWNVLGIKGHPLKYFVYNCSNTLIN